MHICVYACTAVLSTCRIVLVAISASYEHLNASSVLSPEWEDFAVTHLDLCWSMWHQMDVLSRKQSAEGESLYKIVTHCASQPGSSTLEQQITDVFPSYEHHFAQEEEPDTECNVDLRKDLATDANCSRFSENEMELICKLHILMYSKLLHHVNEPYKIYGANKEISDVYHLGHQLMTLIGIVPGL